MMQNSLEVPQQLCFEIENFDQKPYNNACLHLRPKYAAEQKSIIPIVSRANERRHKTDNTTRLLPLQVYAESSREQWRLKSSLVLSLRWSLDPKRQYSRCYTNMQISA